MCYNTNSHPLEVKEDINNMLRIKSKVTAVLVCCLIFAIWTFASVVEFFTSMIPFFNRHKKSEHPERIIYYCHDCEDRPIQDSLLTKERRRHSILPKIIESKVITRNVNVHYIGRKPMINRPVARTRRRQRAVFSHRKVFIFLVCTVGRKPKTIVR